MGSLSPENWPGPHRTRGFDPDNLRAGRLHLRCSPRRCLQLPPQTRSTEELIVAVHVVAAGDSLLSPSVTRRVIDRMAQQHAAELVGHAKLGQLTTREREVLELIARGLSNREIPTALVVEESTIRTHVKRILMKLNLRDRGRSRDLRTRARAEPASA